MINSSSEQNLTVLEKLPAAKRSLLIRTFWLVTWFGLVAGVFDRVYFEYVVYFTAFHLLVFLVLGNFRIKTFPIQLRAAYFLWVVIGTYVPGMIILMYITVVGLATNIFLGYCPLARMLYLLPNNRKEPFTFDLLWRVIITPPTKGRFEPVKK